MCSSGLKSLFFYITYHSKCIRFESVLILSLLFVFFPDVNGEKLQRDSVLHFSFARENTRMEEAGAYFNVVTIENRGDENVSGTLFFRPPENWILIGSKTYPIDLDPGEKIVLPIRIGIPKSTIGGTSYLIRAVLRTKGQVYYRNAYLSIKKKSDWRMIVDRSDVYLSDFKPTGNFSVHLRNRGNSNELIKLKFDKGALLRFQTFIEADSILFVELPAYKDTVLSFGISQRKDLSYTEIRALKQSWKSTSVYIEASTSEKKEYDGIRVIPLVSKKFNDTPLRTSPLNLDLTLFNLLSYQRPKASFKVHGKLLLPEERQFQYSVGMYNLYFNSQMYEHLDFLRIFRYMLRYNDPKTQLWVGDRLGTGSLHTMTGRGLRAKHSVKDRHNVYFNFIQNPYGGNLGSYAGYGTMLGKMAVNTGITVENASANKNSNYSFHLGGTYRFFGRHTLRLQTATTLSKFIPDRYLEKDTTTLGFAYRLSYHFKDDQTSLRIDNTNTSFTFLKNAGINRFDVDLKYRVNEKLRFYNLYHHNSYSASRYPYNFYHPENRNINDNGRFILSYTQGDMVYQLGPQFYSTIRKNYNPGTGVATRYENYQPGIMTSMTFNIGGLRSITPNFSFNTMYFKYSTDIPGDESFSLSGHWKYTAGISYYDQAFKLNAYYSSGEASDIYRSVVIDEDPQINQAIHLRPHYERYFNDETIRLSAHINYSYYMPSQRENTIFNVTADFSLKSGWDLFSSFNVYRNSRMDNDVGRITTRDMNLLAGFRKSFDVQQPRMKYHDLTLVGFNDQNGNNIKDKDEKPISNVLINIIRDPEKNEEHKTRFAETRMITDPNGEIHYGNIPEGNYDLKITPLSNLEDLYFLDGQNQVLTADEDKVHYLPLVESYKIKGKVIVDRDPNSSEGKINLEGIRISAVGENGSNYSTLTTSDGRYVLNLPKAHFYTVKIYNVFGSRFMLEQGEFEVQFMENKTINLDFRFSEERRAIEFNDGEQLFDFNIDRN